MLQFSCRFACYHVIVSQTAYRKYACFFWKSWVALKRAGFSAEDAQKWRPLVFTNARCRTCHCRLRRRWCPETDLTSSRWDAVSAHWHRRQESCTHALASSPRFCIMCACPQIMCAKYYELRCMFLKNWISSKLARFLMQCQNSRFFGMQFERR